MDVIQVTEKGGLNPKATENSKQLIKTLYYAMKRNKVFYQFQRSFFPLTGLTREQEAAIDTHTIWAGEAHDVADFVYFPVPHGDLPGIKNVIECPKIVRDIHCLKRMLTGRDRGASINKAQAIGYYVKYILSDRRGKKFPPSVIVENAFGVFGLLLFTVMFFTFVASISKAIAIGIGFFLFIFGSIALHGIWHRR
jgi:hypothetical protein